MYSIFTEKFLPLVKITIRRTTVYTSLRVCSRVCTTSPWAGQVRLIPRPWAWPGAEMISRKIDVRKRVYLSFAKLTSLEKYVLYVCKQNENDFSKMVIQPSRFLAFWPWQHKVLGFCKLNKKQIFSNTDSAFRFFGLCNFSFFVFENITNFQ